MLLVRVTRRPPPALAIVLLSAPTAAGLLPASKSVGGATLGFEMLLAAGVAGAGTGLIVALLPVCRSRAEDWRARPAASGVVARTMGWLAARKVTLMARSLRCGSVMP